MTFGNRQGGTGTSTLLARHRVAIVMAVALWTFGAVLALMLAMPTTARWMQTVDDGVYRLVIENEITILVTVGEVLAFIGSARFMAPFIMAVAVILAIGKRWGPLWVWTLAIAISQLFNTPVKMLFARDRPPLTLVETTGYAFPSGHALTGAVVAVAMVIALVPAGPKRRAWWTIAVVYALVMAWSRVYVRAHWLSDVTAGLAVGAAAAISAALLIDLLRRHTRR